MVHSVSLRVISCLPTLPSGKHLDASPRCSTSTNAPGPISSLCPVRSMLVGSHILLKCLRLVHLLSGQGEYQAVRSSLLEKAFAPSAEVPAWQQVPTETGGSSPPHSGDEIAGQEAAATVAGAATAEAPTRETAHLLVVVPQRPYSGGSSVNSVASAMIERL